MQAQDRRFLFLQGPHGPFFGALAERLGGLGAGTLRICLNAGDRAAWPRSLPSLALPGRVETHPAALARCLAAYGATDIVLYGARPLHEAARGLAREAGLTCHVFEEGYLRPHWITYERGGANGASPLIGLSLAQIRAAAAAIALPATEAPLSWGTARAHAVHGALYHARVLAGRHAFPAYRSHRDIGLGREAWLNVLRLLRAPRLAVTSRLQAAKLLAARTPYHLALLQLGHDGAVRRHSPFPDMAGFIETCLAAFAKGAAPDRHLVFKAHPFEDGREPLSRILRRGAARYGLAGRIHLVAGGPLGPLLDRADAVVTVNSTAGQQALWRGLPLAALGCAVYDKPGLVSRQALPAFFARPDPPDRAAYLDFRRFLLATSQFRGSFYTKSGRQELLTTLPERMLSPQDGYAHAMAGPATQQQPVALAPRTERAVDTVA
ncbi:MAG: capsule biosynthesis protein CapA [Pseudomonadota bacterium]